MNAFLSNSLIWHFIFCLVSCGIMASVVDIVNDNTRERKSFIWLQTNTSETAQSLDYNESSSYNTLFCLLLPRQLKHTHYIQRIISLNNFQVFTCQNVASFLQKFNSREQDRTFSISLYVSSFWQNTDFSYTKQMCCMKHRCWGVIFQLTQVPR